MEIEFAAFSSPLYVFVLHTTHAAREHVSVAVAIVDTRTRHCLLYEYEYDGCTVYVLVSNVCIQCPVSSLYVVRCTYLSLWQQHNSRKHLV